MNNEEAIKAGKATLHRTKGGTVWFLDKNGNKTALVQSPLITKLFEAIRDGSGELTENVITDSTGVNTNVEATNSMLTIGGNGFTGYFGDKPLTDH